MRTLFSVALLSTLTPVVALAAPAAPVDKPSPPARVTVHDQQVPLRMALQNLFRDSGLQYAIEPAVPNTPITLDLQDVPWSQAFRAILLQAGAVYRAEQSTADQPWVFVIGTRTIEGNAGLSVREIPPPTTKLVTLELKDVTFRRALQTLFEGSGLQHAVEPAVPDYPLTLSVREAPFVTALHQLLNLAPGTTYRREGNIYVIGMRPPADGVPQRVDGWVELELPNEAAERMSIEGDHATQSSAGLEVSGAVRITLPNGVSLRTLNARVRVEKDLSKGKTRILVGPPSASPAP